MPCMAHAFDVSALVCRHVSDTKPRAVDACEPTHRRSHRYELPAGRRGCLRRGVELKLQPMSRPRQRPGDLASSGSCNGHEDALESATIPRRWPPTGCRSREPASRSADRARLGRAAGFQRHTSAYRNMADRSGPSPAPRASARRCQPDGVPPVRTGPVTGQLRHAGSGESHG